MPHHQHRNVEPEVRRKSARDKEEPAEEFVEEKRVEEPTVCGSSQGRRN
jgi:hypothetical protein